MKREQFSGRKFAGLWCDVAMQNPIIVALDVPDIAKARSLVKELARVVKPGGSVALLAWSSEKLLPGHPLLEGHLNATSAGIALRWF